MLFSQDTVADFINQNFEPAWEMVRPVPIVQINFGNGTVITRTLHGNIATYVCTADGQVLDILPGIYTPGAYLQCLDQFRLLAAYADGQGKGQRAAHMIGYHHAQAAALRKDGTVGRLVELPAPITKMAIERSALYVLLPAAATQAASPATKGAEHPDFNSPEDLRNWKLLAEDTRVNETARRLQIHDLLAETGLVRPEQVKRRLYREVLHADLDDPYLGLGSTLFADYPFKEDQKGTVSGGQGGR